MKKLTLLLLSFTIIALSATATYAQDIGSQKLTAEEIAQKNPPPKKTNVEYAPNAILPTLAEQITTTEKMLKQLYATPIAKRPVFITDKIARLENELKVKKAKQAKSSTN
jgi:hypothetical protein